MWFEELEERKRIDRKTRIKEENKDKPK